MFRMYKMFASKSVEVYPPFVLSLFFLFLSIAITYFLVLPLPFHMTSYFPSITIPFLNSNDDDENYDFTASL